MEQTAGSGDTGGSEAALGGNETIQGRKNLGEEILESSTDRLAIGIGYDLVLD